MFYAIICQDKPNSLEQRLLFRQAHRQRLLELQEKGLLLTAGPMPAIDNEEPGPAGFTGSLIIAEFPTLADAQRWADEDPYWKNGIYQSVSVNPFKRVYG